MTTYTATITKTQNAQPCGEYKPTALDDAKDRADIRILCANGGSFTVSSRVSLSGRGIKQPYSSPDKYEVTDAALNRLRKTHDVRCDF